MTRASVAQNRLSDLLPPGGRPRYASLTAGLLARKGEASPASPRFAGDALDLETNGSRPVDKLVPERSAIVIAAPGPDAGIVEPEHLTAKYVEPEYETPHTEPPPRMAPARDSFSGSMDLPLWRLKRLGLDTQRDKKSKTQQTAAKMPPAAADEPGAPRAKASESAAPTTDGCRPVCVQIDLGADVLAEVCRMAANTKTSIDCIIESALRRQLKQSAPGEKTHMPRE